MNGIPKEKQEVGLGAAVQPQHLQFSPEYLKFLQTPQKIDPKAIKQISAEDPPIEPVYTISPVAVKHGLAAMLAKFGIGI